MDIKETAKQLLKATTAHSTNLMLAGLCKERDDQNGHQNALNKIQEAEEKLTEVLSQFQQSIIEQCNQSNGAMPFLNTSR